MVETIIIVILVYAFIVSTYKSIDAEQRKQGGKPITQSPVILISCGFFILVMIILMIFCRFR